MHVGWKFAALLITAPSLGPSFAHVLEAPPRLEVWPPQLWIDAAVFHGQYVVFGALGAPLDGGAILVTAALAYLTRAERPAFWWILAGSLLFAFSLVAWLGVVAPANAILASCDRALSRKTSKSYAIAGKSAT